MTPRPNTSTDRNRARPCPLCASESTLNVISVYSKHAFNLHVRALHPGMDPTSLWQFPLPNRKAAG